MSQKNMKSKRFGKVFYYIVAVSFISVINVIRNTRYMRQWSKNHDTTVATNALDSSTHETSLCVDPPCFKGLYQPCLGVKNQSLTDVLISAERGWATPAPQWVQELCPEVVEHYEKMPSFIGPLEYNGFQLPVWWTDYSVRAVCTLYVAQHLAASVGATLSLHAGSLLGAILHGQPIPWDDDIDAIMPFWSMGAFLEACDGHKIHSNATIVCARAQSAVKVHVKSDLTKEDGKFYKAPCVDIFFFEIQNNIILERNPDGRLYYLHRHIPTRFFPLQPFYFAGIHIMGCNPVHIVDLYGPSLSSGLHITGPNPNHFSRISRRSNKCSIPHWNHLQERPTLMYRKVECCRLAEFFPFTYESGIVYNGKNHIPIYPWKASHISFPLALKSLPRKGISGRDLSAFSLQIDHVDVDNSISSSDECAGRTVKVISLNASGGARWLEAIDLLRGADVIVLNDMDMGKMRSNQQHTARLLAHMLGMNYAWGVEYLDLTKHSHQAGNATTGDIIHLSGLRGNALLARCKILDPVVFRNKVNDAPFNQSSPLEKVGGRMGIFAQIIVSGDSVVIGSMNNLEGQEQMIERYIHSRNTIIVSQHEREKCSDFALRSVKLSVEYTSEVSCITTSNNVSGICTNLRDVVLGTITQPCITKFGVQVQLSDQPFMKIALGL